MLGEIKRIELERAVLVADAGRELGLSGLADAARARGAHHAPWDGIFAEHRRALLTLAQEIDAITKSNRERAPGQRVRVDFDDDLPPTQAGISQYPGVRAVQSQNTSIG